jgi:hypothetical protein
MYVADIIGTRKCRVAAQRLVQSDQIVQSVQSILRQRGHCFALPILFVQPWLNTGLAGWDPMGPNWLRHNDPLGPLPPLPSTSIQATMVIDITSRHPPAPGEYVAAETIHRLQQTQPGADAVPPPTG